jgi:hypothetical protein
MCRPSVVADDWVVKGFHIHIGSIELVVRPDHTGRVMFRGFFSGDDPDDVDRAIRHARDVCLPDEQVRERWVRDARRAIEFMRTYRGALESLANGRLLEFRFLILALERYEG